MSDYEQKKKKFDGMMTLYGRKPVLEVLLDTDVPVYRLHVADSNSQNDTMREIEQLATDRHIETVTHTRQALSRISKNGRQDQGVAIDIQPARYQALEQLDTNAIELIGLEGITNPQNLGMIIRSVAASPMDGLLLPRKGCAKIDPLVHKASAGTLFKSKIYHTGTLEHGIARLKSRGFEIIGLSGDSGTPLVEMAFDKTRKRLFLLGNETTGLSAEAIQQCDGFASIAMANNVESINVAAAATIVSFRRLLQH